MLEKEEVLSRIVAKGISREKATELMEIEMGKYSGLLTENGAAILVAKKLGIALDEKPSNFVKILLLEEGMHGVAIRAVFSHISPLKKIRRGDKDFSLVIAILSDDSGEIPVKLWDEKAFFLSENKVERGDAAVIGNAYVSSYEGKKELSLDFNSSISILGGTGAVNSKTISLKDISAGMSDVDFYCRVKRVFGERTFKRDFGEGKLFSFEAENSGGTSVARIAAWDSAVSEVNLLSQGDIIKIESASVKDNNGSLEIHLNWRSRVILNPKIKPPAAKK